jgi:hypothetical protein
MNRRLQPTRDTRAAASRRCAWCVTWLLGVVPSCGDTSVVTAIIAFDSPETVEEGGSLVEDPLVPVWKGPCATAFARACASEGDAAILRCEEGSWIVEQDCEAHCREHGGCVRGCLQAGAGPQCACVASSPSCENVPYCDGASLRGPGGVVRCQEVCEADGFEITLGCVHDPREQSEPRCACANLGDSCSVPGRTAGCVRTLEELPEFVRFDSIAVCEDGVWGARMCESCEGDIGSGCLADGRPSCACQWEFTH